MLFKDSENEDSRTSYCACSTRSWDGQIDVYFRFYSMRSGNK